MLIRLVCFVRGHRWTREVYEDADGPDPFFLRCRRCARVKEVPDRTFWGGQMAGG